MDENAVRSAAGITLVIGAVAFNLDHFEAQFIPLQVASAVFFAECLVRTTAAFRYSPAGLVTH